jgi:hypothetical protein
MKENVDYNRIRVEVATVRNKDGRRTSDSSNTVAMMNAMMMTIVRRLREVQQMADLVWQQEFLQDVSYRKNVDTDTNASLEDASYIYPSTQCGIRNARTITQYGCCQVTRESSYLATSRTTTAAR